MMLTQDQIAAAAARLVEAERARVQTGLLSIAHPEMTMDDAYAVQAAFVAARHAQGRKTIGWKIGLTSKAMQSALNIATPDSGVLMDDMVFEDGATIAADRFIQPRIEAELAFVMKAPLAGPGVTVTDVINATDYILPALEILDTRILRVDPATKKARTIVDTISDNAANAGIVTGGRAMRPDSFDPRWAGAIVMRNAEVEETGLGAGVLNQPARGIAWLANRLALYGQRIEAGQIVLSGSFIRPIEARHGDTILADFGPLGTVGCYFA
jgi:2-oxo-hept-3-ene-1,7-dioate hydratase